jgi:branched-chain amino acid transport system permease protein
VGGTGKGIDLIVYGMLVISVALARPDGIVGLFARRRRARASA